MSNKSSLKQLSSSLTFQRKFGIGIRLVIAVILIVFALFPVLWVISASFNPTGTLATQTLIPKHPDSATTRPC